MANMFDAQYQPLKRCPQGPLGINFATYWYRFRYSKDFWICSKCYQDNIADTFLTSLCERFYDDILPGTRSICDFNNARCKQLLHAYMQHRQIGDLLEYGKRRAAAGMCTGTEAVHGGRGLRWYSNAELPGFVACEACFHDYILASPFGEKFFLRDLHEHGPKHAWSCDVVVPFIRQALFSGKPWALIVAAIQHRMSLPACGGPKQATKLSSRKWYQPVKPFRIDGMRVCEACFLDRVAALPAASNFAEADIMPVDAERFWFCELVDLPISICTQELLEKDYPRWHSYINGIITKPMCTRENITDGEWYGIVDPQDSMSTVSNADVCSACYTGLMRSTDCEGVFRRLAFPSGTTRCCDFSPMSSRSPTFLDKWRQMLFTRDPTPFQRWASKIAPLPVCTKMQSVSNQRWWGTDDFCFCEACFEEVGRGSYFAPSFPHQGGILESANCDMYSDNMRRRYAMACRAQSLDEFTAYSRERTKCWNQFQTSVRIHREQQAARNRSNLLQMSLMGTLRSTQMVSGSTVASAHGHAYNAVADPAFMAAHVGYHQAQDRAISGMVTPEAPEEIRITANWLAME